MKILIIAGSPTTSIPQLGITFEADQTLSGVDTRNVIECVIADGHNVSVLTCDENYENVNATMIMAVDVESLTAKAKYLSLHVEFDAIVNLLMLPWWSFMGMKQLSDRTTMRDQMLQPYDVEDPKHNPLLMFTHQQTFHPFTRMMYNLRADGCKAGIITLTIVNHVGDQIPRDIIEEHARHINADGSMIVMLDNMDRREESRRVCICGRSGCEVVPAAYVTQYITSALHAFTNDDVTQGIEA